MPHPKLSDTDFAELFERVGQKEAARRLDQTERGILKRRKDVERRLGRPLIPLSGVRQVPHPAPSAPSGRVGLDIENGVVIVGGDGHYWPGAASVAHRAFVRFAAGDNLDGKPKAIILNGDSFDGARISRHPPINWEAQPSVIDELEAVKQRHQEIEDAAHPKATITWNLGNHDSRFETRLAAVAPEYARVYGFHLKDHFSARWRPAWATWINGDVVVKHRCKGGVHATHNNTLASGVSMVTNHLHSAKVTPYTDYNGTRYGVDTGCLAYTDGPQFAYNEDNPKNWREGFAVLTFFKGKLLMPELVTRFDGNHVQFRGKLIRV
jgi:hypothetical protein